MSNTPPREPRPADAVRSSPYRLDLALGDRCGFSGRLRLRRRPPCGTTLGCTLALGVGTP